MILLDGKKVRDEIRENLRKKLQGFSTKPVLSIIQVEEREDSNAYIAQKKQFAERIGVEVNHLRFPEMVEAEEVAEAILRLNKDDRVHGIIVQLPLPKHLQGARLLDVIDYKKDVDGLSSVNMKLLLENNPESFVSATAKGILSLLDRYDVSLQGKEVVVVGRSVSVGKPIALACLNRNATVTIAHHHSDTLPEITKRADILIVAVGKEKMIGREYVRAGQVVIDVGINTTRWSEALQVKLENELPKRTLVGDVDFESVKGIVSAISPVPGGVGPLTVASLFENLFIAFERVTHS